jgi:hypothetical protein
MTNSIKKYPKNSVFYEVAGSSIFFGSVNYERVLLNRDFFSFSGRLGIGNGKFMGNSLLTVPLIANGIFNVYHSIAFEIGMGAEYLKLGFQEQDTPHQQPWRYRTGIIPTTMIGIRIQLQNGFLFRATFTPYFFYSISDAAINKKNFTPWLGLSFGGSFGK